MRNKLFYFLAGLCLGLLPYDISVHNFGWIGYDIITAIIMFIAGNKK